MDDGSKISDFFDLDDPDLIREVNDYAMGNEHDNVREEEPVKEEEPRISEATSRIVTDCTPEMKADLLRWNHDRESIKIDDDGDIVCIAWGNYAIKGTGDLIETCMLIDDYVNECQKPKRSRDLGWVVLLEKRPAFEMVGKLDSPKLSDTALNFFLGNK